MSAARPNRNRARVNYVEPTELDDDIAVEDDPVEPKAAAEPADDQSSESDSSDNHDNSDADEFTTDKRKLKAQEKALKKKKAARKAKKAKKASKPKKIKDVPFPFMDLPPEIRVMIYKEALVESARELTFVSKYGLHSFFRGWMEKKRNRFGQTHWNLKRDKPNHKNRTPLQPVLLRVCKAIRDEALPFLYGQTIYFETPSVAQRFLGRISPVNRTLLRDIVIRGWTGMGGWRNDLNQVFALLTTAANVKRILLDRRVLDDTDSNSTIWSPQAFWQDVEWWADAVDGVNGKGSAKEVLQFTKICFGSKTELKNKDKGLVKREKDFMCHLKFSVKPADKSAQPATNVAGIGEEIPDASDK